MNNKEIEQIEDAQLREIRMKYWNLKHKAFLDEHRIPDNKIGEVFDYLTAKEEEEVSVYLRSREEKENGWYKTF